MSESQEVEERTETNRFVDDVSGEDLIVGDQIDNRLVARTFGQLGTRVKANNPVSNNTEPKTQLVAITAVDRYDDVHRALLADTETGTIIRASRHSSQSAWSQKEADWTVREIGSTVAVDTVHDLNLTPRDDEPESQMKYVQGWIDVVIGDLKNGYDDYSDDVSLASSSLKLRDVDGRKAYASISLEGNQ
jgi:hypothetical protein